MLFFLFDHPTFLYLLNFVVDGTIVVIVLGCYAWLAAVDDQAQGTSKPAGPVAEILSRLTETLVPEGGAIDDGTNTYQLDEAVWRYFHRLHPAGTMALRLILYGIEYGPYVFGPRRRRFSRLSPAERESYLHGWETSRIAARRQLLNGIKLAVTLHFYDSPQVCAAIGYDGAYLRKKLLDGPNAEHHSARLSS